MPTPDPPKAQETVRKRKAHEASAVQRFLPIAEIRQDCVVLKNGGLRAIVSVGSMNFNLKSEQEQMAILQGYQGFLNTIEFPLQMVVRSMRLNVDTYLASMREKASKHENPLLKENTLEYCTFIERLIESSDIMQKRFYAIVPMDLPGQAKATFMQKYMQWLSPGDSKAKAAARLQQFAGLARRLGDRVSLVQSGLENVGLSVHRLTTSELIELFYQIYNPDTSQAQKLTDVLGLQLHGEVL